MTSKFDPDRTGTYFVPLPRESPAGRQHLHTVQAGAWLPLAQAVITGMILGLAALVIVWVFRARNPWTWGAGVFAISCSTTWLQHQRHWFSLTKLENLTGLDLNGDQTIGSRQEYEPPEVRVRLSEVSEVGHWREQTFSLPVTIDQLQELAEGITTGRPFSEREWCGKGKPFSINQFRQLRIELLKRGCVAVDPNDARQGFTWTRAGAALIREMASPTSRL
jgi:hypothetical protein